MTIPEDPIQWIQTAPIEEVQPQILKVCDALDRETLSKFLLAWQVRVDESPQPSDWQTLLNACCVSEALYNYDQELLNKTWAEWKQQGRTK